MPLLLSVDRSRVLCWALLFLIDLFVQQMPATHHHAYADSDEGECAGEEVSDVEDRDHGEGDKEKPDDDVLPINTPAPLERCRFPGLRVGRSAVRFQ